MNGRGIAFGGKLAEKKPAAAEKGLISSFEDQYSDLISLWKDAKRLEQVRALPGPTFDSTRM